MEFVFESPVYIDSTGDGALAFFAGAKYRMGREGKSEFGEKWAPDKPDSHTMGHTLFFETKDMGRKVDFKRPNFAHNIFEMDFLKNLHKPENFREFSINGAHWTLEYGGQANTIMDSEAINMELRKLVFGIWDYIKNSGKYPEAENYALTRVYAVPGTRESRRVEGDYILTENDIEEKKAFEDAVCIGGWPMDVHAPLGIYDSAPASNFIPVTGPYNIPFRCLYSRNITNLMTAGRDISVTHIALGSTRVIATCACQGQAVGTAAYLCVKYGETPREVGENHIKELQYLIMKDDQSIIGLCDSLHPELERGWKVSGTSEAKFQNTSENAVMPLVRNYGLAVPVVSDRLDSVKIRLKNTSNNVQRIKIDILKGTRPETYVPEFKEKSFDIEVAPLFDGWAQIDTDTQKGEDGKVYIVFGINPSIELYTARKHPFGAITLRFHTTDSSEGKNHDSCPINAETGYIAVDHIYEKRKNILFKDAVPQQRLYSPQNLLGGYSRPYGAPNIWISENSGEQTINLKTDTPKDIGELQIIFDTMLETDALRAMPPMLAKKYTLKLKSGENETVIKVDDNHSRLASHTINMRGVDEISLILHENYGGDSFGIYSIRFFPVQDKI